MAVGYGALNDSGMVVRYRLESANPVTTPVTAKLKKDISPNKKAVKENASHFVMVNEEENRPLINPYNKHGNIKVTRRATHRKPIKHPSLIKKYVNSHENYTDFF